MSKPVVYLLPGLLCDEAVWQHQTAALAAVAEVRIPVLRGFSSLTAMALQVLATAPPRFSVVGHSMGGRVAFEIMALVLAQTETGLNRKTIEHFAVMDTGVHPVQDGEAAKREILLGAAARNGLQAVADKWILPMLHPAHQADSKLIARITAMILRNSVEDYRGQVSALLARSDRSALLPRIQQSVWLLCGDADSWSPLSQHEDMQRLLPRAQLRVIEQAGHMGTLEQPEAVSKLLLEWINESE
jgi:pimeloyl-ACP methyl ester carboxylesterase